MGKIKLSLIAVLLLFVTGVSAQVYLGVKGGLNMSNLSGDELGVKNPKIGFHVGLSADYEFMYNSAIQTGLYLTTKGFKTEITTSNVQYSDNLMYLQLPVHYAYKLDVTPGTRIVLHAGPYAALGIGGSRKASVGDLVDLSVKKIFGNDNNQYKPFDAGVGIGVGAEFGPIVLDLGWDMGLVNISNVSNESVKNQNAYLSVGYKF